MYSTKYLRMSALVLVVKLADAYAQPRTVVIVTLHTVVAHLAVYRPNRSVDAALWTIFLVGQQVAVGYKVFVLPLRVQSATRWQCQQLTLMLVLAHYLRQNAWVDVHTQQHGHTSENLQDD